MEAIRQRRKGLEEEIFIKNNVFYKHERCPIDESYPKNMGNQDAMFFYSYGLSMTGLKPSGHILKYVKCSFKTAKNASYVGLKNGEDGNTYP